mgnify:CR=1 FL=1
MAGRPYQLEFYTPDGPMWEGEAVSIIAPGLDGYFGVWASHQPMVAALDIGELIVRLPDGSHEFFVTDGGFLEVHGEGVRVLADSAAHQEDIDVSEASKELADMEEQLNEGSGDMYESMGEEQLRKKAKRRRTELKVAERDKPPT